MSTELTDAEIDELSRNFKRCREGTVEAIINLRRSGDPSFILPVLRGIVWRYVRPELRELVDTAPPDTPLSSLGMDSLMMLEVVLDVQDALDVVVEDTDLRRVRTIGDVNELLMQRFAELRKDA
jgi:3-hydroxyacyl-[acyl-carrier-protein] dehydratase